MQEFLPTENSDSSPFSSAEYAPRDELPVEREPVAQPPAPVEAGHNAGSSGLMSKLTWVLCVLIVLLVMRYVVPNVAEELQYAITRGQERAKYEVATDGLKTLPLHELSKAYQMVSRRVGPSVVHIFTSSTNNGAAADELPPFFGQFPREAQGQGSGVVVDSEGYIVTNYHVIRGSNEIRVTLSEGRSVPARVVGFDAETDLAVLKVRADNLIAAEWGDSDELEEGALVWAVGSPFGLERTVTFGIISAKHRAGKAGTNYQDFLQTDAAVNPGNSGGPLVDEQGRVVGINTAIIGETYQGISFAIPSSVARKSYEQIKKNGYITRGWLGVAMDTVSEEFAKEHNLPAASGALVATVVDAGAGSSPAKRAGMQVGDVIVEWNGQPVDSPKTLSLLVADTDIGSKAEVKVLRDGQEVKLQVAVGERPRTTR
jgi:serine protease Do